MCEISIIVPVYNVENYLAKCIDSILTQTFYDFEVILVDDGSQDNSGKICDEYAERDRRVKVIHKKNGGLSSARNAGIDVAKGKYLGFVDSDDYIDKDMYELMYNHILLEKVNIVSVEMIDVYDGKIFKNIDSDDFIVLNQKEVITAVMKGSMFYAYATNKLFEKRLFESIRFPEGKIVEDAFTIIKLLMLIEYVAVLSASKYYYYHRSDSIIGKSFSHKTLDVIEAWKQNQELVLKKYPDLKDVCLRRTCWAYFFVLDKLIVSENYREIAEKNRIINYLKENRKFILKYSGFTKTRKLAILALSISESCYRALVHVELKKKKFN